jgi:hypothetical protein
VLLGLYLVLKYSLSQVEKSKAPLITSTDNNAQLLEPVEIAYLSNQGDSNLVLTVLLFDLLHYQVKLPLKDDSNDLVGATENTRQIESSSLSNELSPDDYLRKPSKYQNSLEEMLKTSFKDWAQNRLESNLQIDLKSNPLLLLIKIPLLYKKIVALLRGTVQDIIKEPGRIKKYFAPQGMTMLLAELVSKGFRDTLVAQVKGNLLKMGMLEDDALRRKKALKITLIASLTQMALIILTIFTTPDAVHALCWLVLAFLGSLAIQINLALRKLLPLYEELSHAVTDLARSGRRLNFLRFLLNILNTLLSSLSIGIFTLLIFFALALFYWLKIATEPIDFLRMAMIFLLELAILSHLFRAYALYHSQQPSAAGRQALSQLKTRIRGQSSLDALKSLCLEKQYSKEPSYLLAYYGVESILFL